MKKQIKGVQLYTGWVTVKGYCIGESLFIHRDLNRGKDFIVTHQPTGRLITGFNRLYIARQFAETLNKSASDIMRLSIDIDNIHMDFSKEVRKAHDTIKYSQWDRVY